MLSGTPARLAGIERSKGKIQNGMDADLVIADSKLNITNVILGGRVVR